MRRFLASRGGAAHLCVRSHKNMNAPFIEEHITLCRDIQRVLDNAKCRYELKEFPVSQGNGPWYEFHIQTKSEHGITLDLVLYDTSFHVMCDECECRVEIETYRDNFELFAKDVTAMVTALFGSNQLRLRKRKTIFGRKTGAIYFEGPGKGGWCGELFAAKGKGKEHLYKGWVEKNDF